MLNSNDINNVTNFIYKIDLCIISSTKKNSKTFNSKNYKLKLWITKGIIVSIRHKEKMCCQKNKNPNNMTLISKYNKFRNLLNILIKKAKNIYYHSKINNNKGNVKKLWETIKYVTYNTSNNSKNTAHSLINNDGTKIFDSKIIPNTLHKNYTKENFKDLNKGWYLVYL